MHIPDGFIDAKTWAPLWVVSATAVGAAAKRAGGKLDDRAVPLLGVTAAFIFAAQMLNFPVGAGTSGHFSGGVLAAILLGPASGLLVMSTVLGIQCLVFQDGGLTALGANIFNMGLVGSVLGYLVYRGIRATGAGRSVAAFVSAWLAVVCSASFCAVELGISGTVPLRPALVAMAGVHAIIGMVEGAITVMVLGFLERVRPDLLRLEGI